MILLDAFALPVSVIGLALLFAHRQDPGKQQIDRLAKRDRKIHA